MAMNCRRLAKQLRGGAASKEGAATPDGPTPDGPIETTCTGLLQWMLSAVSPLLEIAGPASQPVPALRLLLTAAVAASEEAGEEEMAYTLVEEVGLGAACSMQGPGRLLHDLGGGEGGGRGGAGRGGGSSARSACLPLAQASMWLQAWQASHLPQRCSGMCSSQAKPNQTAKLASWHANLASWAL